MTIYSDFPTDQTCHQFHAHDLKLYLHRITSGFHGAFAMCVACQQRTLTGHLVPLPPSFVTCLCSNCWYQFSRTCCVFSRHLTLHTIRYFLDFAYLIRNLLKMTYGLLQVLLLFAKLSKRWIHICTKISHLLVHFTNFTDHIAI